MDIHVKPRQALVRRLPAHSLIPTQTRRSFCLARMLVSQHPEQGFSRASLVWHRMQRCILRTACGWVLQGVPAWEQCHPDLWHIKEIKMTKVLMLCLVIAGLATPYASAKDLVKESVWVGAAGKQCTAVCKESGRYAVRLGGIAGYDESYVCAGAVLANEQGKRAGFAGARASDGALACHVFSGGKMSGETITNFSCLCVGNEALRP